MIEKILTIKNITKFKNFNCVGDLNFGKLTLIYGENGKGKSSLASIFRSLQQNDNSILSKCSIGSKEDVYIKLKISNGIVEFKNNSWSRSAPNIIVFDSHYVNENIFSGNQVNSDHKKNLYYLVIGEKSVKLSKEIEDIDSDSRQFARQLTLLKEKINVPNGLGFNEFLHLDYEESVDDRINEIEKRLENLQEADLICSTDLLNGLVIPDLNFDRIISSLNKSFDSISPDTERKFNDYCKNLGKDAEKWIRKGIEFGGVNQSFCPFCGSDLKISNLYEIFIAYFSESYQLFKLEIESLHQEFEEKFSIQKLSKLQTELLVNDKNKNFWQRHVDLKDISFDIIEFKRLWIKLSNEILEIIKSKINSPLEVQDTLSFEARIQKTWEDISLIIVNYNDWANETNKRIISIKESVLTQNLLVLKQELTKLKTNKQRYDINVKRLCDEYLSIEGNYRKCNEEKKEKQKQLTEFNDNTLKSYQSSINEVLSRYGADFKIVEIKSASPGGKPSISYCLQINGEQIQLGSVETTNKPCFRTTLSDGEKNALAFAFFISHVSQMNNLSEKVLIIDDPITSQDRNHRGCTKNEIRHISEKVEQVIVLSHDPLFLKEIGEYLRPKNLSIVRSGKNGVILTNWDIEEEVKSQYEKDYSKLEEFVLNGNRDLIDIARCLRTTLEGYLRAHFPNKFSSNEWLGDFVMKIDEGDEETFGSVKKRVNDLREIKDYSKRYHHSESNNISHMSNLTDSELLVFVKKTLEFIKE